MLRIFCLAALIGLGLPSVIGVQAEIVDHRPQTLAATNAQVAVEPRDISDGSKVLTFLDQKAPEVAKDLRQWKETGYDEDFASAVRTWSDTIMRYDETLRESPRDAEAILRLARLNHECDQLVEKIHESNNPSEKTQSTQLLREKLGLIFDGQLQQKEKELTEQKQELAELRKDLAAAKKKRKAHVREGVNDLQTEIADTMQMLQKRRTSKTLIISKHLSDLIEEEALRWWE